MMFTVKHFGPLTVYTDGRRVTVLRDDKPIFSEMGLPSDAHGDYAAWAAWAGNPQPSTFQACVESMIESIEVDE